MRALRFTDMFLLAFALAALVLLAAVPAAAQEVPQAESRALSLRCNSYSPLNTMFTDVCWSGMFPMRIAGQTMVGGRSGVPADATNRAVCACGGEITKGELPRIGFTVGFWAPSKLIDVTRDPYCMPSLGGVKVPLSTVDFLNGGANVGRNDKNMGFANWTMYSFPLVFMLRLIDEGACPPDGLGDFDIITASPMFPNWNDAIGRYTIFVNPEMLLFANVASLVALPADAVASTLGKPINSLFWVGGAWGTAYPITGFHGGHGVGHSNEPVRQSSLAAFRALSLMHRLGFLSETVGAQNLCSRHRRYVIRKDAYRWQMIAPSPEVAGGTPKAPDSEAQGTAQPQVTEVSPPSRSGGCTHATGASTVTWGMWRDVPATGEDHSYLLFQWTDCCFGAYGG